MIYTYVIGVLQAFVDYMNKSEGKNALKKILNVLESQRTGIETELESTFDKNIVHLIKEIEKNKQEAVIIILKNKHSLYDIFIFKKKVEFSAINLVSSEVLEDTIRRNPVYGFVIENVSSQDILVFLKAYYIYRKDPHVSLEANNMFNEYSSESLEMLSIQEEFGQMDPDTKLPLKSIILYEAEALPYNLGYLDEHRKTIRREWYDLEDIIKDVREDRFLGMSLKKYRI